jgi:hypothetical protein
MKKMCLLMPALLISTTCFAYKIGVRNHTKQTIEVEVKTVGKNIREKIKPGEREKIETKGLLVHGIDVETTEGKKRKGSAGMSQCKKKYIRISNQKKYQYECRDDKGGAAKDASFDIFLPDNGGLIYGEGTATGNVGEEPVDKGDNLIVVRRYSNVKY